MLYFLKFLFLLINIDQKPSLDWFELKKPAAREMQQILESGSDIIDFDPVLSNSEYEVSIKTFQLMFNNLWQKVQTGLTLSDIENVLFLILFIRFVIIVIRYNLKTSFYITLIGIFAGGLWYRHLMDLITAYQNILINVPFLNQLGIDVANISDIYEENTYKSFLDAAKVHWYNPGQLLYYSFVQAIIHVDSENMNQYYIDPISMIISNLQEPTKSTTLPFYYKIYNRIIPKIYDVCSKFWSQISGIASYAIITRIGKRYCPYLVRWHWTFILIISLLEQVVIYFIYRAFYFQAFILVPQLELDSYTSNSLISINFQIEILSICTIIIMLAHLSLTFIALLHAIAGQYFYVPFFVENTELHIGPRPKDSVYSGGYTSWQDKTTKGKNSNKIFPKIWYGWFGRGNNWNIMDNLIFFCKNLIKSIWQSLRKLIKKFKK